VRERHIQVGGESPNHREECAEAPFVTTHPELVRVVLSAAWGAAGGPAHVDTAATPQQTVAALIHRLAADQGVAVQDEYCTNQPPEQLAAAARVALDRA